MMYHGIWTVVGTQVGFILLRWWILSSCFGMGYALFGSFLYTQARGITVMTSINQSPSPLSLGFPPFSL